MNDQKQQLVDRLKEANNILVTVSNNPSVDQLAAAIGLTLALNKLGKHGTAVFSGKTPDTIEFLKPEETLEENTDSLRDFIIALDKTKADKLRYKVEDKHVKIFITPYKTSITQQDLEFSQGDFNVDLVITLGVHEQQDLDQAFTAHGRILHDATVAAITTDTVSNVGTIIINDPKASSLCEIVAGLTEQIQKDILDSQMSTALLTGIVAETARFSNEKTTSLTMNISAKLMAAGANQQLVATKLQEKPKHEEPQFDPLKMNEIATDESLVADELPPVVNDGSLQIDHPSEDIEVPEEPAEPTPPQINIDEHGEMLHHDGVSDLVTAEQPEKASGESNNNEPSRIILSPPTMGGTLTGSANDSESDPSTDALSQSAPVGPMLSHSNSNQPTQKPPLPAFDSLIDAPAPEPPFLPEPTPEEPIVVEASPEAEVSEPEQTLSDLEKSVDSPHLKPVVEDVNSARDAVMDAINSTKPDSLDPIQALNAQSVDLQLHGPETVPESDNTIPGLNITETGTTGTEFRIPSEFIEENEDKHLSVTSLAPPPVPPPMMPPLPGIEMGNPNDLPTPGQALPPPANPSNPFNLPL